MDSAGVLILREDRQSEEEVVNQSAFLVKCLSHGTPELTVNGLHCVEI